MNYQKISVKDAYDILETSGLSKEDRRIRSCTVEITPLELSLSRFKQKNLKIQGCRRLSAIHSEPEDVNRICQKIKDKERCENKSVLEDANVICISDEDDDENASSNKPAMEDCFSVSLRGRKREDKKDNASSFSNSNTSSFLRGAKQKNRMEVGRRDSGEETDDDFWQRNNPMLFPNNNEKRNDKKLNWKEKFFIDTAEEKDVQVLKEVSPLKEVNGCEIKSRRTLMRLCMESPKKAKTKPPLHIITKKRSTTLAKRCTDKNVRPKELTWYEDLFKGSDFVISRSNPSVVLQKGREAEAPFLCESDVKLLEACRCKPDSSKHKRREPVEISISDSDSDDEVKPHSGDEVKSCVPWLKSPSSGSLQVTGVPETPKRIRPLCERNCKRVQTYADCSSEADSSDDGSERVLKECPLQKMKLTDSTTDDAPIVISDDETEGDEGSEDIVQTLSSDVEAIIDAAFEEKPNDTIMVAAFGYTLTWRDVHRLADLNWLNDEVINFYMMLIMNRSSLPGFPAVYCFNTFFYKRLSLTGYETLKRWTRKVDIFEYEMLIIPIHLKFHWILVYVNIPEKLIHCYDSMGHENTVCLQKILDYLCDELLDKKERVFPLQGWKLKNMKDNPQQLNGSDCGVFVCVYAEHLTRRAKMTFSQRDIPFFRRKMAYEIICKKLIV